MSSISWPFQTQHEFRARPDGLAAHSTPPSLPLPHWWRPSGSQASPEHYLYSFITSHTGYRSVRSSSSPSDSWHGLPCPGDLYSTAPRHSWYSEVLDVFSPLQNCDFLTQSFQQTVWASLTGVAALFVCLKPGTYMPASNLFLLRGS